MVSGLFFLRCPLNLVFDIFNQVRNLKEKTDMNDDWDSVIELNNDADMKARELLADELRAAGITDAVIIWPDERRAYLDTGNGVTYAKLAKHFNISLDVWDKSPVDDALLERYNALFEQEREKLREQH